jgi:hypothetical protein
MPPVACCAVHVARCMRSVAWCALHVVCCTRGRAHRRECIDRQRALDPPAEQPVCDPVDPLKCVLEYPNHCAAERSPLLLVSPPPPFHHSTAVSSSVGSFDGKLESGKRLQRPARCRAASACAMYASYATLRVVLRAGLLRAPEQELHADDSAEATEIDVRELRRLVCPCEYNMRRWVAARDNASQRKTLQHNAGRCSDVSGAPGSSSVQEARVASPATSSSREWAWIPWLEIAGLATFASNTDDDLLEAFHQDVERDHAHHLRKRRLLPERNAAPPRTTVHVTYSTLQYTRRKPTMLQHEMPWSNKRNACTLPRRCVSHATQVQPTMRRETTDVHTLAPANAQVCTVHHTTYNIRQRSRAAASDATMQPTNGRRATDAPTVALAPCAVRIRRGFESTRTRPSGQQLRACRTFVRHRLHVCRPQGHMLSVARCILHVVAGCISHAVCCMQSAVCCMLPVACFQLHVVCCMLSVACCLLHVVCCKLWAPLRRRVPQLARDGSCPGQHS